MRDAPNKLKEALAKISSGEKPLTNEERMNLIGQSLGISPNEAKQCLKEMRDKCLLKGNRYNRYAKSLTLYLESTRGNHG